jgi:RNA polymerase sigma-70 factor (sigma-E family)
LLDVGGRSERDRDFEEFFDKLFPRAQALALRIVGNRGAAEDVAAEALTRAYVRWPRLRGLSYRDGWVLRVASNLAIDAIRRRPVAVSLGEPVSTEDLGTLRVALAVALHSLPARQRDVIALRYLSDLSEADVAAALGMAVGTVKSHTHRGLVNLRGRLGDVEEVALAVHRV